MKFYMIFLFVMMVVAPINAAQIIVPVETKNSQEPSIPLEKKNDRKSAPTPRDKPKKINKSEVVAEDSKPTKAISYIGDMDSVTAKFEDTLLQIGRDHNLGYVEMVAANPNIDPILPGSGKKIILPKRHLIPDVKQTGIVINLAEMRMYDFVSDPENPKTYPLGIGRDGLNTPLGVTKITRKKDGPSWRPTPRMKREDPTLPDVVPPGEENPLGTHALYLGWPAYLIHGTHKPLGVGRRVSSGCIRMYPEDILKIFENIPVGTEVNVIKQPIKMAWIGDMLYIEAHAEDELADSYEDIGEIQEYRVPETLFANLSDIAGEHKDRLDWKIIREAVKYRRGVPLAILKRVPDEGVVTEDVLKEEPVREKPTRAPRMDLNN